MIVVMKPGATKEQDEGQQQGEAMDRHAILPDEAPSDII